MGPQYLFVQAFLSVVILFDAPVYACAVSPPAISIEYTKAFRSGAVQSVAIVRVIESKYISRRGPQPSWTASAVLQKQIFGLTMKQKIQFNSRPLTPCGDGFAFYTRPRIGDHWVYSSSKDGVARFAGREEMHPLKVAVQWDSSLTR
jgi:hypothetical protein